MSTYDPRVYARLAQEVYTAVPDIDNDPCKVIFRDTEDGFAVVWQGTHDVDQMLADLAAVVPVWAPTLRCWVPGGFWDAAKLGWEPIFRKVKEQPRPWVAVAHSLGAAEGILTAALAFACGMPPKAVFAFEPPRTCFGSELGLLFHAMNLEAELLTRCGLDIVTEVPMAANHPMAVTKIGVASELIDNVTDHAIATVIAAVDAAFPKEEK